jgi:gluconolactonase
MVNITHVDVLSLAASIPYANELTAIANASSDHVSFISYSDEFLHGVLGNNATQQLVAETSWEAFHEAGVYNIATGLLYATSNWNGSFDNPINVTVIDINHNNEISSQSCGSQRRRSILSRRLLPQQQRRPANRVL